MLEIKNNIVKVMEEITGNEAVAIEKFDVTFKELDVDSLDHFNILLELEELYSINFPEEIDDLNTVNAVAEFINKEIK